MGAEAESRRTDTEAATVSATAFAKQILKKSKQRLSFCKNISIFAALMITERGQKPTAS